mgnify:CR=1 FL=1
MCARFGFDYFVRRWRGEVAPGRLFWHDMLLGGTLLNVASTLAAFGALAVKAPSWLALALHFAPVPYNAFIVAAVWRSRADAPLTLAASVAWFVVMLAL